jgi:hypothetical protein
MRLHLVRGRSTLLRGVKVHVFTMRFSEVVLIVILNFILVVSMMIQVILRLGVII